MPVSTNSRMYRSYAEHPGFQFHAPAMAVDAGGIEEFSAAYRQMADLGQAMKPRTFDALAEQANRLLSAIFGELRGQVKDRNEGLFLDELEAECRRLLREESNWYRRKTCFRFLKLDRRNARVNALGLQADRFFFGSLAPQAVMELQAIAATEVSAFRSNAASGKLRREDLSTNVGATVRKLRDALDREFRDIGVLDAVGAYVGRRVRVGGLALELSVPQATWWKNAIEGLVRPPKTLYAHLDETISCPKSIVYLSNVEPGNGATGCFPGAYEALELNPMQEIVGRVVGIVGSRTDSPLHQVYSKQYHQSMNSLEFRRQFMRLPEALRFNSHLGWDVAPDSEFEDGLASTERLMTGPAGTFMAFDGARLLHRGGMVQHGERLALQVVFSDQSRLIRAFKRVTRTKA